jgi:ribosomal-protein-serine acetyltransferase
VTDKFNRLKLNKLRDFYCQNNFVPLFYLSQNNKFMFRYKLDEHSEIRMLEERHAETLFALVEQNRERHLEIPQLFSLDEARKAVRRDLTLFAEGKGLGIGIWHCGEFAGGVRYHEIDWENRSTEFGYWLGAAFEGKGLVTKVCRVMIAHAFEQLKLNRIVIICDAENPKSRAVAERLGFTQEGVLRQSEWLKDRFINQTVYSLLADEWRFGHENETA